MALADDLALIARSTPNFQRLIDYTVSYLGKGGLEHRRMLYDRHSDDSKAERQLLTLLCRFILTSELDSVKKDV